MDYTPKIPREKLEHGAYYLGRCRNASVARWNGKLGKFFYYRLKFGHLFIEEINAPEADTNFDVFVTDKRLYEHQGVRWIPFDDDAQITRDLTLLEPNVATDFLPQDVEGLTTKPISYLPYVQGIFDELDAMEDGFYTLGREAVMLPGRLYHKMRCALMRLKRLETIIAAKDDSLPTS